MSSADPQSSRVYGDACQVEPRQLSPTRQVAAWVLAIAGPALLTLAALQLSIAKVHVHKFDAMIGELSAIRRSLRHQLDGCARHVVGPRPFLTGFDAGGAGFR
jgi:hypothetical protein